MPAVGTALSLAIAIYAAAIIEAKERVPPLVFVASLFIALMANQYRRQRRGPPETTATQPVPTRSMPPYTEAAFLCSLAIGYLAITLSHPTK